MCKNAKRCRPVILQHNFLWYVRLPTPYSILSCYYIRTLCIDESYDIYMGKLQYTYDDTTIYISS